MQSQKAPWWETPHGQGSEHSSEAAEFRPAFLLPVAPQAALTCSRRGDKSDLWRHERTPHKLRREWVLGPTGRWPKTITCSSLSPSG